MVDLLMFLLQPQYHHQFLFHLFCLVLFLFHLVCRLLFLSHHLLSINISVADCLLFKFKWAFFQIYHNNLILNEWLIDWCLASSEQFFSNIIVRTNYILIRWWWFLLCTSLIFYSASSLNNSLQVDISLHSHTLSSNKANQSLISLLNAAWRSNKYQFHSLWYDPNGVWPHNLQHLRRTHHQCSF